MSYENSATYEHLIFSSTKTLTACNFAVISEAHGQVVPFGSLKSHTVWSQVVLVLAGLLELKTLS